MGMKLPPDLEAKVLAQAATALPHAEEAAPPPLIAAAFTAPGAWHLPLYTAAEINGRDWKARSRRTKAAWKAVSLAFGPRLDCLAPFGRHLHAGRPLRVALLRLGPRRLDPANLGTALKAAEDAAAHHLGYDDGGPLWRAEFHQTACDRYGVVVTLEAL